MKFFKPKYTICEQCKVHFEPEPNDELGRYCQTCRVPIREKTNRKLRVVEWASANWERLEKQFLDEDKKASEARAAEFQQMANLQGAAMSQKQFNHCYGLYNNVGMFIP